MSEKVDHRTTQDADIIEFWILTSLVKLHGHRRFIQGDGFARDEVMYALGLERFENGEEEFDKDAILKLIRGRYKALQRRVPQVSDEVLLGNVMWLKDTIGLSDAETDILILLTLSYESPALYESLECIGDMSRNRLQRNLGTLLGKDHDEVRRALSDDGALLASGILRLDVDRPRTLCDSLELLDGIEAALLQEHEDRRDLLKNYFAKAPKPRLSRADYEDHAIDFQALSHYLHEVNEKRISGVNVLIYGPPGTGKTQLVHVLADSLKLNVFEVAMQSHDGNALKGETRFSVYQLAQRLLRRKHGCLILFDEVEDVFPKPSHWLFGKDASQQGKKAWINRLLETNPVPAMWLSNEVGQIDRATLRRFDYVLEMRQPSPTTRRKILKHYFGELPLTESWINRMAEVDELVPAQIEQAARVAKRLPCDDQAKVEAVVDRIIGNSMTVMGNPRPVGRRVEDKIPYQLDILNADADLRSLMDGIAESGFGRLCLYGPPGTGKTAFAAHLAREVGRPLLKKRASDIISPWVGETEQNIASIFARAQEERAVLLVDEADSFLQERARAQASWEITAVNEFLVQMEGFEGVFVASTNLVSLLDHATFRRFDVKIRFDYMQATQAMSLLREIIDEDWRLEDLEVETILKRLSKLNNIAVGDFSALQNKQRVTASEWGVMEWIRELERECALKPDFKGKSIGFVT